MLAVDLTVEIEYAERLLELELDSEIPNQNSIIYWQSKVERLRKELKELM